MSAVAAHPAQRAVAQPMQLRGLRLRNRVVAAPMERNYCDLAGRPTQQYVDYLGARAAGGAALVFTESSYVSQVSKARPHQMGMHDDGVLPGLAAVAEAVHRGGALLGVELNHAGRVVPSGVSHHRPVGPSAIACEEISGEVPHPLTTEEVREVVAQFAAAARRAVRGGADVLSVHGAHGYLVGQFLSPRSNRRSDVYRRPTAFLEEVVRAVRSAVGEAVPLFLRLSAFEGLPGGRGVRASLELVDDMPWDAVDVIDLSAGTYGAGQWITPSGEVDEGYLAAVARRYRERSGRPVCLAGRIASPDVAERLVASGDVDLVAAARALHADPTWARHVVEGTVPRPCVSCNQGCADVIFTGEPLWCAANPATGDERAAARPLPRTSGASATVVGGGPAGLQAALVLAQAGARVVVHEREGALGGQYGLAATLRAKPQFGRLLDWYTLELLRLGVDVRLGSSVTAHDGAADVVVVAVGSEDYVPRVPGVDDPRVHGVRRWLRDRVAGRPRAGAGPGGGPFGLPTEVTIWGADRAAVYVTDELVTHGVRVTLVARGTTLAPEAGARERLHAVQRLERSDRVDLHLGVVLEAIHPDSVVVSDAGVSGTSSPRALAAAGPLLVSLGTVPRTTPVHVLDHDCVVEHAVGRGSGPETFDDALRRGEEAARRALAELALREPAGAKRAGAAR